MSSSEAYSVNVQVPVIVDENQDGKWVNDSWEIAKYLEKTYPNQPSLFKGTSGAAFPSLLATMSTCSLHADSCASMCQEHDGLTKAHCMLQASPCAALW